MAAKLFVGNLPFRASEAELRELFSESGTVVSAKIVTDVHTGRSRGFGFVEMASAEAAARAVEQLNGKLYMERPLTVAEARSQSSPRGPQASRPQGEPRGTGA
jgi:RNA recognition motif-containing protein